MTTVLEYSSTRLLRSFLNARMTRFSKPQAMSTVSKTAQDWSAAQYLKFEDERTQPARDLLARIPLKSPKTVVDLGCGPGNSTAVLESRFPDANLIGIDSSPDMIRKAQSALPHREFTVGDLRTYRPHGPVDLFFSNAVFQWLGKEERFVIVKKLLETQPSGGVFALQVPDNLMEPSHVLMRETAKNGPWASALQNVSRDVFQTPREIYDLLKPICSTVEIFHTTYNHSLENHAAIVEWVKGTGLRPYLDPLSFDEKEGFLREYLKHLEKAYMATYDGRVLLAYPRLFVVAVKK
ncbi:Trans-aconitate 2-methyltransferase [Penicillium diatomitis]|uniref:Trans-aconitate 2-methyltransferase n=1 Tax=Penicillium diatomitis TaxID=2819901 RepID=A0A9W9X6W1_9EURO|nr:Trans-aconitate 2-methyltransferase [Penicillium diatomitis]KAJ5485216.1 Trans-aconitate 2-methyltransferase [Penicillium diatomitis]